MLLNNDLEHDNNMLSFEFDPCTWSAWSAWTGCVKDNGNAGSFMSRNRTRVNPEGLPDPTCKVWKGVDYIKSLRELKRQPGPDVQLYFSWYEQRRSTDEQGNSCIYNAVENLDKVFLSRPNDRELIILADESTSITPDSFGLVKKIIANLVQTICGGIGQNANRVSVLRFSAGVKHDVDFIRGSNKKFLLKKINNLRYKTIKSPNTPGSTYTAQALSYISDRVLNKTNNWRPGKKTEILIITDGRSNDPLGTFTLLQEKEKLKERDIEIFAMGIGSIYEPEINFLTSNNENHMFYFPSWGDFGKFGSYLEYMVGKRREQKLVSSNERSEICLPLDLTEKEKSEIESRMFG